MNVISILIRLGGTALFYFLPDLLLRSVFLRAWSRQVWRRYQYANITLFIVFSAASFLSRDQQPWLTLLLPYLLGLFVAILFAKMLVALFWGIVLLGSLLRKIFQKTATDNTTSTPVSRRQFLAKATILSGLLPFSGILYGIARGRFRFTLHRVEIPIANLPDAFNGFTIVQLSDLHVGSFDPNAANELTDLVNSVNQLNPDALFFTGDIVNSRADEMDPWYPIFNGFNSPIKMSVLGNHDYGDYVQWPSPEAREKNLDQVKAIHGKLGFQLLLNEKTSIQKQGQHLHIIGIENWGKGDFPKLGDLDKAAAGLAPTDCMILLSHDPSFWESFVLSSPFIPELTLSGHTHGFQMGIETPAFRFSPSQWIYRQWAGLYQQGTQHLYVNRGLGTVGYPGRLGIWPEITHITLRKA